MVSVICLVVLGFVALILVTYTGILKPSPTSDAVEIVAREFGVPRERVVDLAQMHGVDPDRIGDFGDELFPLNYYLHEVNQYEVEHGEKPTRSWVKTIARGYIAECIPDNFMVAYLYYSDRVHPQWFNTEIAFAIWFHFDNENPDPADHKFSYAESTNLRDGSVNLPDSKFWDDCIQAYRNNNK